MLADAASSMLLVCSLECVIPWRGGSSKSLGLWPVMLRVACYLNVGWPVHAGSGPFRLVQQMVLAQHSPGQ